MEGKWHTHTTSLRLYGSESFACHYTETYTHNQPKTYHYTETLWTKLQDWMNHRLWFGSVLVSVMSATFITILQFCVHSDKHELMQSLTEDVLQGVNFEAILNQLCEAIGQGKQTFMYSLTHAEEGSVSYMMHNSVYPPHFCCSQANKRTISKYILA